MKTKTSFVFPVAVVVLSSVGLSNAMVLDTIEYNKDDAGGLGGFGGLGEFSEVKFSICYPLPRDWESISLFWNVTPDDVGKTFFASADTHQNFDRFTYLLTNGNDNGLFLPDNRSVFIASLLTGLPEPIKYESSLLTGVQDGVDFEGYTIDSIALTVNELFIDYHEAGPDSYTDYSYDITYTIYGTPIPEPATLLLFGLGAVLLRGRRRV